MSSLHFMKYGESGQPLVILHGLFGALGNWHTLAKKFGESFRVFTIDQRNHGQSFHSDEFNYELMAADLKQFLSEQQLTSIDLIGHSMGGKTAMTFALNYPELIDKLIVADIAPRAYARGHQDIFAALMNIELNSFNSRNDVDAELAKSIPDFGVRQFLLKNLARDDNNKFFWRMNLPAIYRNYDEINKGFAADRQFNKPTLFIRGGKSPYVRDSDMELISAIFPQVELATIENAGHWVHAEAPAEFARIVLEFLKRY